MKARVKHKRGAFVEAFMSAEKPIARAATMAVKEAGNDVKSDARAKIASAGFGKKWQNALRADVYPKRDESINAAAHIYHKIHYAHVFEEGAKISGKPLLWLPLSNVAKKVGRRKLTPQNYPGALQYVRRPGKNPLLMAKMRVSKAAARRAQMGKVSAAAMRRGASGSGVLRSVPIFVGISTVTIRKRFSVRQVTEQAAARLGELYMKHLQVDD